jgi:hypothetical protein
MNTVRIVNCRFPITMQQAQIKAFCEQFNLTYLRHTAGGDVNNYWLVVEVEKLPAAEMVPTIKKTLVDYVLSSILDVAIESK